MLYALEKNDLSPKFYRHYPRLFMDYFEGVKLEVVDQLSKAGYLYYHSTLLTDSLIDDRQFSNFSMITLLQEETIKLLTSVYGKDSDFWQYWNRRREEYFRAIKIERKMDYNSVNFSEYEDLADKKSAYGKVAIDCLYLLSNKADKGLYELLLQSHYFFSVGFQLYDDVKDFKEDFGNGQFNWAIYEQRNEDNYEGFKNDVSTLNKLLFINGTAQKVMAKSAIYFQKAMGVLEHLNIDSEWMDGSDIGNEGNNSRLFRYHSWLHQNH